MPASVCLGQPAEGARKRRAKEGKGWRLKDEGRDFPSGPVVKTLCFQYKGSMPG